MINIAKIPNDKYYTSPDLAEYCVRKTEEIIGKENITEYLEPSAGNGVFLDYLDKPYFAYDIEPEDNKNRIIKADYLSLNLEYKKGRCIIGNPPFGRANCNLKKFYKKCVGICDYISFVMPISQYKNNYELYDYDLIYSKDLGIQIYSGIEKHCCLNIYVKPIQCKHKPKNIFNDIEIVGWRKAKSTDCDFYICCYGTSIGKFVSKDANLININGIIIHNKEIKERIIKVFKNADWCKEYSMTSTPNLLQWQIYKYIKEQIPEIQ